MKTVYIFPGQGSQYVGMGKDLYDQSPVARKVFEEADEVLGFALSRLCFEGPFDELTQTKNCQPAVLTVSAAALKILEVQKPGFVAAFCAGLSLGEYTALLGCGVLNFKDAVYLVRKRGEYMEAAAQKNPGKMSCVLGLEADVVREVCEKTGCEVANLNCPGQVVISGAAEKIESANQLVMERGAKRAILLDVSGAFHCSLMSQAAQHLQREIEKIEFRVPRMALVANVDALPQTDPEKIKANLIKQVDSATYWEASMRFLLGQKAGPFIEIGPGTVLKGLFKKIDPAVSVLSAGKWEEIQQVAVN